MNHEEVEQTESPELQLEKVRLKRVELEAKLRRDDKAKQQAIEESRDDLFREELRRQLASTNISFHPDDSELKMVMESKGWHFLVQNNGTFVVEQNGTQIPFKNAVEQFAVAHPFMLTDRSQIANLSPERPIRSKSDLPTAEAKNAYIKKFGLEAFERLPLRGVPDETRETITAAQYLRMSLAQKAALGLDDFAVGHLLKHGSLAGYEKK